MRLFDFTQQLARFANHGGSQTALRQERLGALLLSGGACAAERLDAVEQRR